MASDKYLPEEISWFRLPEYLRELRTVVENLETVGIIAPMNQVVYGTGTGTTSSVDLTFDNGIKALIVGGQVLANGFQIPGGLSTQVLLANGTVGVLPGPGIGEANTASNLAGGFGLFASKVGSVLSFKSLVEGTNMSFTTDANTITINGPELTDIGFVPLSGTALGSPVTGRVEFTNNSPMTFTGSGYNLSQNGADLNLQNGAAGLRLGANLVTLSTGLNSGNYAGLIVSPTEILVSNTNQSATYKGLEGKWDYSLIDPTNDLIYAQRKYVDDAISSIPGGGSGEINTASNLAGDQGIFATKVGADLRFKSLIAGTNVTFSADANSITINSGIPTNFMTLDTNQTVSSDKLFINTAATPSRLRLITEADAPNAGMLLQTNSSAHPAMDVISSGVNSIGIDVAVQTVGAIGMRIQDSSGSSNTSSLLTLENNTGNANSSTGITLKKDTLDVFKLESNGQMQFIGFGGGIDRTIGQPVLLGDDSIKFGTFAERFNKRGFMGLLLEFPTMELITDVSAGNASPRVALGLNETQISATGAIVLGDADYSDEFPTDDDAYAQRTYVKREDEIPNKTVTSNYTILPVDRTILVDASSNSVSITTANTGFDKILFRVKRVNSDVSANNVLIFGEGGALIDNAASISLASGEAVTIQSDGTNFHTV